MGQTSGTFKALRICSTSAAPPWVRIAPLLPLWSFRIDARTVDHHGTSSHFCHTDRTGSILAVGNFCEEEISVYALSALRADRVVGTFMRTAASKFNTLPGLGSKLATH